MLDKLIIWLRDTADVLSWVVYGAWLMAILLSDKVVPAIPALNFFAVFGGIVGLSLQLFGLRRAKTKENARLMAGPGPEQSAWGLTLALGSVTTILLFENYREPSDAILPLTVLAAIIIAGFFLSRFARLHVGDIGEARFGPDGNPLGPWQPPK